jgi:hypothetical protein
MSGYPIFDIFLTTMYVFGWILWIVLMFMVISDIFRSPDLGGWAKAGWLMLTIVLPLVGVLIYLIARGGKMRERQSGTTWAGGQSQSDELAKLAGLHQRGVINDSEFQRAKSRVLLPSPGTGDPRSRKGGGCLSTNRWQERGRQSWRTTRKSASMA